MRNNISEIEDMILSLDTIVSGIEENSCVADIAKRYRAELESFHHKMAERKLTKKEKMALKCLLSDLCGFIYVYCTKD